MKKEMTKEQALLKLTSLCSSSEQCSGDMLRKMDTWGIGPHDQSEIMEYLVKEKYVDDSRYCHFFVNDKIKYNKWGRRKVEQALWAKGIPGEISKPVLDEVPDELYAEILTSLLREKRKSVTGRNDYEKTCKLVRFAQGRGFTYDIINRCIRDAEEICDDEI